MQKCSVKRIHVKLGEPSHVVTMGGTNGVSSGTRESFIVLLANMAIDDQPATGRRWRRRYVLLIVLVASAALIVWWYESERRALSREIAAGKAIQQLGAIVVMDGNRRYPASVNLSTLQSPESLAKALEHLPVLKHLTSLDASRTPIRDEQLSLVAKLASLNSLSLNSTAISDEGVERLVPLRNLQAVFLASTGIEDRSLTVLSPLKKIRILDLSATKVSADLEPLTSLPQLEWLVLRDLTLLDDALLSLRSCPSLRRLSLEDSNYQVESLQSVEQSLPELAVDR